MKKRDLLSSPEHAEKERYAAPYMFGMAVLFILLMAVLVAFGYELATRP